MAVGGGQGCIHVGAPDLRSTNRSSGTGDLPFDLITTQAATAGDWVLLGELDKYTTVSARRFSSVAAAGEGLELVLAGATGELVTITALHAGAEEDNFHKAGGGGSKGYTVVVKAAMIGADGTAKLDFK